MIMVLNKTKNTSDVHAFWTHANNKSTKESKLLDMYFSHLVSFSESFFTIKSKLTCQTYLKDLFSETYGPKSL